MLRGIYGSELSLRKKEIFLKHKYIVSPDIKINQLLSGQRIYIRVLASLLKNPELLIIENIFIRLESRTVQELVSVINNYISHNGICLLLTCNPVNLFDLTDSVYLRK